MEGPVDRMTVTLGVLGDRLVEEPGMPVDDGPECEEMAIRSEALCQNDSSSAFSGFGASWSC